VVLHLTTATSSNRTLEFSIDNPLSLMYCTIIGETVRITAPSTITPFSLTLLQSLISIPLKYAPYKETQAVSTSVIGLSR